MKKLPLKSVLSALLASGLFSAMNPAMALNPNTTSVQMFHWKWNDIAKECTNYLGPQGYGAVQISPPNSTAVLGKWYDLYQPVDYNNLNSRMGTVTELQAMINACHNAGVRVYADVVANHLAAAGSVSSAGVAYNPGALAYPRFSAPDFHSNCTIQQSDYNSVANGGNRNNVINCRLVGLPDFNTASSYVRTEIKNYLNTLINMGMDGFRLDAAKHISPADVSGLLTGVLRTTKAGEPLWLTQEIIPDGNVVRSEYFGIGGLNEFQFPFLMKAIFRNLDGYSLSQVRTYMGTPGNWGGTWGFMDGAKASVFVNNWDTERDGSSLNASNHTGIGNDVTGTKRYDIANIFMLAWPYGHAQVHSGFKFTVKDADRPSASPFDANGNPLINVNWDFIHRWSDISNMVAFRNTTNGTGVDNFVAGNSNQIAFNRGAKGFVAINNDAGAAWNLNYTTALPAGTYCNVAHGVANAAKTACSGSSVTVSATGAVSVSIPANNGGTVPAVALHVNQKLTSAPPTCTSVPVKFRVANAATVTGQSVYVNGNLAQLGNWTATSVNKLTAEATGSNAAWSRTINLPPSTAIQFKFMKSGAVAAVWERNQPTASGNRQITTVGCGATQTVDVGSFAF
jgi:alpha-amylase